MVHPDARQAYRAAAELLSAAGNVTFLQRRLKPLPGLPRPRLEQLLGDLDSDSFTVRETANQELAGWGDRIRPELERALAAGPNLEARRRLERLVEPLLQGKLCNETLRQMRAVAVLEYLDTPAARSLLERLSKDSSGGRLQREARAAWQRCTARAR